MKRETTLCDKCDKPIATRFWLHLFHDDGREERILNGTPPAQGRFVAVYVDVRCKKGWAGKISQARQAQLREGGLPVVVRQDPVSEVDDGGRLWSFDDLVVQKKGDRILMVMPKMVGVV